MKKFVAILVAMALVSSMAFANGKKEVKPITNNQMKEMVYTAEAEKWIEVDVEVVKETNTDTTVWHNK